MFRKKLLILSFLCFAQVVSGQQNDWWINTQLIGGAIIPHSEAVKHLVKGRPTGFELSLQKALLDNGGWAKQYKAPIINYGISYYDLKNEAQLGNLFISSWAIDFSLVNRKRSNLYLRIGSGLVYSTNPYDREQNNQNNMIGSKLSVLLQTRLTYQYRLNDYLKLTPALNITHASNGGYSAPNKGINMLTLNMGLSCKIISRSEKDSIKSVPTSRTPYNLKYAVILSGGKNTLDIEFREPSFFYNLTFMAQKYLTPKSDLQLGVEYFHSNAVKNQISASWFNRNLEYLPDFRRIGLFIGHELKTGSLGFFSHLGVYLYNPSKYNQALYQRYGVRNEFTKHIIGQVSVKVHMFKAEQIEFGLGWII